MEPGFDPRQGSYFSLLSTALRYIQHAIRHVRSFCPGGKVAGAVRVEAKNAALKKVCCLKEAVK